MPRAGPLKQLLRPLSVTELQAVHEQHCPRVGGYEGDKTDYVDRIRNALNRDLKNGEFDYETLMTTIRRELRSTDNRQITTRLRDGLSDLVISSNVGREDGTGVREAWICSEAFQVLRNELAGQPYQLEQEHQFGRLAVDMLVSHTRADRNYVIEVKLAGSYSSRERLLNQLRKYRKRVPNLRRTYVLMVAETGRDLPENKESVAHVLEEARNEPHTEVVLKGPDDLLY